MNTVFSVLILIRTPSDSFKIVNAFVNLLFNANAAASVVDREGKEAAKLKPDVSAIEPFTLRYPDGTDECGHELVANASFKK
jgi:hypothetical protein